MTCHVMGYQNIEGYRDYSIEEGEFGGSFSFYNEWVITTRYMDGSCEHVNYCCFEGTREECEEWIRKNCE